MIGAPLLNLKCKIMAFLPGNKLIKPTMKIKTFLLFFFAFNTCSYAQLVQNKSYNVMLKTLLSHNVKEVGVKEESNDSTATFLDAREKTEYNVSHLKNAIGLVTMILILLG